MQHTLTFTHKNKKYVSKPFNFETACLINDIHNSGEKKGPLNICRDALDYIFEGTEATQDIINDMDVKDRVRLCIEIWGFYAEVLTLTAKN